MDLPENLERVLSSTNLIENMFSRLLAAANLSASKMGTPNRRSEEIERFRKLYNVTKKSIKKDIELSREDSAFAVIAAPWFPVKCYYALYYLESILVHLIDGASSGFGKAGHGAVRKAIAKHMTCGAITLGNSDLSRVFDLTHVRALPTIQSGQNARFNFWKDSRCISSVLKKLMEYKLQDAKLGRKWNLHMKKHQVERQKYIATETLVLVDFFYWYRIKSNYRDLDYIDFEAGLNYSDVLEYIEEYYEAYRGYQAQLIKGIRSLI